MKILCIGAHIAGSAGKAFQEKTNKLLPRITGFDPAKVKIKKIVIGKLRNFH